MFDSSCTNNYKYFLFDARPNCYVVNVLLYIRNKLCLNQDGILQRGGGGGGCD